MFAFIGGLFLGAVLMFWQYDRFVEIAHNWADRFSGDGE